MIKLTDTQAVLLSSASQRANGSLLPLPTSLAGSTRLDQSIAGLLSRAFAEERETSAAEEVRRTDGDLRFGLFITAAGEAAIGVNDDATSKPEPQPECLANPAASALAPANSRQTKTALVLGLLGQESGATLSELIAATGWLPHTTRAALTGLRKKGLEVIRGKRGDVTCYSVAAAATSAAGAR